MLYKIVNDIAHVPKEEISTSELEANMDRNSVYLSKRQMNTKIHSSHIQYPSGTVCQKQ
jgi:hypothetical protein